MEVFKVGSKTKVASLAGAIAGVMRESDGVLLHAVGAGALNQAVKAVITARGFLAPSGINIVLVPSFGTATLGDEERTSIVVEVKRV